MKTYLKPIFDLDKNIDLLDEIPLWSAPFGLKLLEYIDYKVNITALDIGFGNGFPLTELAMRLGNSSKVYGIDPWKAAIERTLKKIQFYGISNIKIIEGHAESIPLDNNSIDLIVSNNGINNVDNMDLVFSECSRILKHCGQFVQTMNLDKSMFEFYGTLEKVLFDLHMKNEIQLLKQHIYEKRKPLDEIIEFLTKHGFEIRDLVHNQFDYKFCDGTTMLNHYFIRLAFMDSWIKILPKDKIELIFEYVETKLNEHAKLVGGLKLSIPFAVINAIKR